MPSVFFHERQAIRIENNRLRVTVLMEGGHIGELLCKETGVNPLWIPPWPSIEPSSYDSAKHSIYGCNAESKPLSGLMGHTRKVSPGRPLKSTTRIGSRGCASPGAMP